VLFLDELGEFSREALEALRQPLEEGSVAITRARGAVELPCRFMLVAASNPCPCGRGERSGECECRPGSARRYRAKLSGALADRVDIAVAVERPSAKEMGATRGVDSAGIRARVVAARERQERRLGSGRCNAGMDLAELRGGALLTADARRTVGARPRAARAERQGLRPRAPRLPDDRGPRGGGAHRGRARRACDQPQAARVGVKPREGRAVWRIGRGDPAYPGALLNLADEAPGFSSDAAASGWPASSTPSGP
jgi:hypothetical protein